MSATIERTQIIHRRASRSVVVARAKPEIVRDCDHPAGMALVDLDALAADLKAIGMHTVVSRCDHCARLNHLIVSDGRLCAYVAERGDWNLYDQHKPPPRRVANPCGPVCDVIRRHCDAVKPAKEA